MSATRLPSTVSLSPEQAAAAHAGPAGAFWASVGTRRDTGNIGGACRRHAAIVSGKSGCCGDPTRVAPVMGHYRRLFWLRAAVFRVERYGQEFGNQLESALNRADLNPVGQVDYLLARDHVPS